MKTFFIGLAVFLAQSANAQIVENVTQKNEYSWGPFDRETVTVFEFALESCATYLNEDFEVRVEKRRMGLSHRNETFVRVQFKRLMADCMGPTRLNRYSISTKELELGERYILENPSVLKPVVYENFDY